MAQVVTKAVSWLGIAIVIWMATPLAAETARVGQVLPGERAWAASAASADRIWLAGGGVGCPGTCADVLEFSPDRRQITHLANLPGARWGAGAGRVADILFVLGGFNPDQNQPLSQIVRISGGGAVSTLSASLPGPRYFAASATSGGNIYLFGGKGCGTQLCNDIIRFSPDGPSVVTMSAAFSGNFQQMSAAAVGSSIFIFGGNDGSKDIRTIWKYTPATDTLATLSTQLPMGKSGLGVASNGQFVYLFGGQDGTSHNSYQIMKFDGANETITLLDETLPTGRTGTTAAWIGDSGWILGGSDRTNSYLNEIVRFYPANSDTANQVASAAITTTVTVSTVIEKTSTISAGNSPGPSMPLTAGILLALSWMARRNRNRTT